MVIHWQDYIVSTPDTLKGKPRIKGTRIPVGLILGYLAAGNSHQKIIEEFPDLTQDHILPVLIMLENNKIVSLKQARCLSHIDIKCQYL